MDRTRVIDNQEINNRSYDSIAQFSCIILGPANYCGRDAELERSSSLFHALSLASSRDGRRRTSGLPGKRPLRQSPIQPNLRRCSWPRLRPQPPPQLLLRRLRLPRTPVLVQVAAGHRVQLAVPLASGQVPRLCRGFYRKRERGSSAGMLRGVHAVVGAGLQGVMPHLAGCYHNADGDVRSRRLCRVRI